MDVHLRGILLIAAGLLITGCGEAAPATPAEAGVTGLVHVGPQCPVETQDRSCEDRPAAHVEVTVSEQLPGEAYAAGTVVARATTDADGRFRIEVEPGEYVVTAEAGMSCELMDVRVAEGSYVDLDVPCDSGIR
jgi:hypothetical protein